MKRILLGIITLLVVVPFTTFAKDKVQVYVYTKDGCGYCEQEIVELNALAEEHGDLFDAHVIEIFDGSWGFNSKELEQLLSLTYEAYNEEMSEIGTPINAIGDFFASGYLDQEGLLEKIKAAYGQEDRVAPIIKKLGLDVDEISKDTSGYTADITEDNVTASNYSSGGNAPVIAVTLISALLLLVVYVVKSTIDKKDILEAISKRK